MSRYNQKKVGQKPVTTHQGGQGFALTPEVELVGLLGIGLDKSYYESSNERENRLISLMKTVGTKDKYFLAQAIVYARAVLGQRSITHRAAVELARQLNGEEWGKRFFGKFDRQSLDKKKSENPRGGIVYRLDDMLEITAAFWHYNKGKRLPSAVQKGFRSVLEAADRYELAKYQGSNRSVKLVDLVNLTHPRPSKKMESTFKELMKDGLKQFNTVEDKNTKTGQEVADKVKSGEITKAEAEVELKAAKADNYANLIASKKIGYLALIRNLSNIIKAGDSKLISEAGKLLVNQDFITKSKVFPHQIDLALEFISANYKNPAGRMVVGFLNDAYEKSVSNIKHLGFDEHTAVVVDTSGSMSGGWSYCHIEGVGKTNKPPIEKAALIGATFAKGVYGDLWQFASDAREFSYNPGDTINTIKNKVLGAIGQVSHGTDIETFFARANQAKKFYKRIFVISDGQDGGRLVGSNPYKQFVNRCGQPYVYYVNMVGYGSQPFKVNDRFFPLAGYSAAIYETARQYEIDPKALINEIKAIVI